MNFENVFEKYKKECKVPTKKQKQFPTLKQFFKKYTKSEQYSILSNGYLFQKTISEDNAFKVNKTSWNTANANSASTSFSLNDTRRTKFLNPARAKPLDVIVLHKTQNFPQRYVENHQNFNASEKRFSFRDESNGNCSLTSVGGSFCKEEPQRQIGKLPLTCSFNLKNTNRKRQKNSKLSQLKRLDISIIPKRCNSDSTKTDLLPSGKSNFNHTTDGNLDESFTPFLGSSPEPSQFIENTVLTQTSDNNELSELIDLIEQQEKNHSLVKKSVKTQNHCKSKILKGGYEELFKKASTRISTVARFLKYNRKFGVQTGQFLTVVDINSFYGTTFATVESATCLKPFGIAISPEMVPVIQAGTKLEAFFDDTTTPYKLNVNNEMFDVYLKPYKLLVI